MRYAPMTLTGLAHAPHSATAVAPRHRPGRRLAATTMPVAALDTATRDAAFALFASAYDGADRARFERDLREKQLVILLWDGRTHQLQGFSTVLIRTAAGVGRPATVVFSGDTVIDQRYWGQKVLQREFTRVLVRLKWERPARPLYWFLISKGYRTYLLMANAFPRAIPRSDRAEPPGIRALLDTLAVERFGAQYDAQAGVVRYATAHECVRAGLAPVEAALANAHVRFFVDRNPGYAAGDELACLAEVRCVDLIRILARIGRARLRHTLEGR